MVLLRFTTLIIPCCISVVQIGSHKLWLGQAILSKMFEKRVDGMPTIVVLSGHALDFRQSSTSKLES